MDSVKFRFNHPTYLKSEKKGSYSQETTLENISYTFAYQTLLKHLFKKKYPCNLIIQTNNFNSNKML